MIFDSNMTGLSASTVPMAEGYDCSYGAALALVESARNDLAVFRAMLNVDARETAIRRENGGYLTEAQYSVICESAISGIWNKIKELFSKLVAKIKAIFHTLISKLDAVFKSNKALVKKYRTEVINKTNIGKLEVKWRKIKNENFIDKNFESTVDSFSLDDISKYSDEESERLKHQMDDQADNVSDYKEYLMEQIFDDDEPETYELSEVGGITAIINKLESSDKDLKDINSTLTKATRALEKKVKAADDKVKSTSKEYFDAKQGTIDQSTKKDKMENATKVHAIALAFQTALLAKMDVYKESKVIMIKQSKAAFVKAIAANNSKLESSYVYLDALEEAAAQEVENVINSAISSDGSELSELNNASRNVLDGGVSDDPDELVYGEDPDYERANIDGTIRTDYSSREESAFFAAPLY